MRVQVLTGISWNTFARVIQQGAQFLLSILLARLLFPEDFGIVAMVSVFSGFAGLFVDIGFGSAVVQRKHIENSHLNAAFYMSVGLGYITVAILLTVAPVIGRFYDQPELVPLIRVSAINFLIVPFGMIPSALLQRSMRFGTLARIEVATVLLSSISCAVLALLGWGVWSLIAQGLIGNLSGTIMKWRASGWVPSIQFDRKAFNDLWGYSINLLGFNVINYWARNGDNMLIGRTLGATSLGIYGRAYALMLLPISQIISVVSTVMFPALSSIQEDKPRVKKIYLEAMDLLGFVIFPIMIGLSAVAAPFILTIYGEKWAEVIPILQLLAFVGMIQSMMNPVGWLYASQGQTRSLFWWGVFGAGFQIASILFGASLGSLSALTVCYAIANAILLFPAISIPGRFIDMDFSDVVYAVYPQLVAALVMGGIVWAIVQLLSPVLPPAAVLLFAVLSGIVLYISIAFILRVPVAYRTMAWLRPVNRVQDFLRQKN